MLDELTCESCEFLRTKYGSSNLKQCRRFPPRSGTGYPVIGVNEPCGEHSELARPPTPRKRKK